MGGAPPSVFTHDRGTDPVEETRSIRVGWSACIAIGKSTLIFSGHRQIGK